MTHPLISELERRGWKSLPALTFEPPPRALGDASPELLAFMHSYHLLSNRQDTQWLLSSHDYEHPSEDAFSSREFELMSLDAATGNAAWEEEVRNFWARHITLFISVAGLYEYVAYCAQGEQAGKYVHGCEPDFESPTVVAGSLAEFGDWLLAHIGRS